MRPYGIIYIVHAPITFLLHMVFDIYDIILFLIQKLSVVYFALSWSCIFLESLQTFPGARCLAFTRMSNAVPIKIFTS